MARSSLLIGIFSITVALSLPFRLPAAEETGTTTAAERLLLKDYRPQSIYNIPKSNVSRARFPVIDMHSHSYARTADQVDQWVKTMDAAGIKRTVILTGQTGQKFDDLVQLYGRHSDRFSLWCGFDLSNIGDEGANAAAVKELERCARAGAAGVGELSDKGGGLSGSTGMAIHIDDPRMDPLLEKCAQLHLPINIHVGEPKWMYEPMDKSNDGLMNAYKWRLDNKTNILDHASVVATLDRALARHPHTTFIACHFANCCYDLSILDGMLRRHPNLYADNAARYAETAPIPRYMAAFYARWSDRLLYGTDMGLSPGMYPTTFRILESNDEHFYDWNLFSYHWPLHGFGLNDRVLKRIYETNAERILSMRERH